MKATEAQREHAVAVMRRMFDYRAELGYPPGDQRTARDDYSWHLTESEMFTRLHEGLTVQLDCSEYVPWVWRCAGLWPFAAPGWTGSDLALWHARGWKVYSDARAAFAGAGVVFGPGDGHHMAVVLEPDPKRGNPLLSSHGRPGLDEVRYLDLLHEQTANGHPGARFLSVSAL